MRAASTARLDAGTECLFDDGVDGACATTAISAATKAAIELLGISQQGPAAVHGIADVMVAEDVTGQTIIWRRVRSVMLPDVACVIEKFRQLIDLRKAALRSHGQQRDKRNCTKVVHSRGCAVESVGNRLREARTVRNCQLS